jgi:hypothetical protein
VKGWTATDTGEDKNGPDETVALYFNRIAFTVAGQPTVFSWDRTRVAWPDHGLPTLPPLR